MTIRLACTTDCFPLLPHDLVLDLISGLEFELHDLMLAGNRTEHRPETIRLDTKRWAGRLAERAAEHGLEYADIFVIPWSDFSVLPPNHPDAETRVQSRDLFKQMVEFTACVGAPGLTLLPGVDWPGESHEVSLKRAATELLARVEIAHAHGVRLSFEPHMGGVCETVADALELCGRAPGLEVTVDLAHYAAQGAGPHEIERLFPHTRHVHVRGAAPGRLQAPMKTNDINFEWLVDALCAASYDGAMTIEYAWSTWHNLNRIDVLSEVVLLRDRLRARLEGREWHYPRFGWPIEAAAE